MHLRLGLIYKNLIYTYPFRNALAEYRYLCGMHNLGKMQRNMKLGIRILGGAGGALYPWREVNAQVCVYVDEKVHCIPSP